MASASGGRRATSADVARHAGVSRATVSYVLNDAPYQRIPPATRSRVLEAAAALGYAPSAAARELRTGRSDVVLLLLPDWPIGPTVGRLLHELAVGLAQHGLTFVAHPHGDPTRSTAEIWKAITPAAVIAYDLPESEAETMRAAGVSVEVALLDRPRRRGFEVELPQQRIGELQVAHLAERGHRRLAYAWPADPRVARFARARLDGARRACAERSLPPPRVDEVSLDPAVLAEAVRRWRAGDEPATAVCAYNDETALGVLAGLRAHGLSAPEHLAVLGADDIPAAALADPPLTTVFTDSRLVARGVVAGVVAALGGATGPATVDTDAIRLIARDST